MEMELGMVMRRNWILFSPGFEPGKVAIRVLVFSYRTARAFLWNSPKIA